MLPKDQHMRFNPFVNMLSKEQELFFKRNSLLKTSFRSPLTAHDLTVSNTEKDLQTNKRTSNSAVSSYFMQNQTTKQCDEIVQKLVDETDDDDETPPLSRSPSDIIIQKRGGAYIKDGIRFNPISSTETSTTCKEKSPTSSTSSSSPQPPPSTTQQPPPLLKPIHESLLLQETIEEETKCVVCNAVFPSVWLLEQHAALQHANLGPMEEKPFICEQCGQSYRYRSAYVKHREQNHRARLPADKLFTCDVCGMQFRYLKSFKKHRLNHALERLHGKHEKQRNAGDSSSELVSSSNEALAAAEEIAELQRAIKAEEDEEEQDDTIDSPTAICGGSNINNSQQQQQQQPCMTEDVPAKITSTEIPSSSLLYQNERKNFILKVNFSIYFCFNFQTFLMFHTFFILLI